MRKVTRLYAAGAAVKHEKSDKQNKFGAIHVAPDNG
jgi:hypothetical protein